MCPQIKVVGLCYLQLMCLSILLNLMRELMNFSCSFLYMGFCHTFVPKQLRYWVRMIALKLALWLRY